MVILSYDHLQLNEVRHIQTWIALEGTNTFNKIWFLNNWGEYIMQKGYSNHWYFLKTGWNSFVKSQLLFSPLSASLQWTGLCESVENSLLNWMLHKWLINHLNVEHQTTEFTNDYFFLLSGLTMEGQREILFLSSQNPLEMYNVCSRW